MFDIRKVKPVHGWRELFDEIGIIVVGITIALLGEQMVESLHWRHKAGEAREALAAEIAGNRVHFLERIVIEPCLDAQLDRLEAAVMARGDRLNPIAPERTYMGRTVYRAPSRSWSGDVWNSVVAEQVSSHLPRDDRLRLGTYYGYVGQMRALNDAEYNAAAGLVALSVPLPLDAGVRAHLVEMIETERQRAHLMTLIARSQIAEMRGAAPDQRDIAEWRFVFGPNSTTGWCRAHRLPLTPMPST